MKRKPHYFQYISDEEDREITKLLQEVIGTQSKRIANAIGCNYQDMLNRITNQPRSPRKFEMVLKILDHVENPEPLIRWLNLRYNFAPPIQLPQVNKSIDSLFKQVTNASKELGDVSRELIKALDDNTIDLDERISLNKEIMDLVQCSLELDDAIRHKYEAGGKS